ncbi:MAG TPA: hypothetical protein VHA11_01495 [Bryobacteraceae bacterium]|nr:hypothetical protein [Bryobacteraceae bacterium]
MASQDAILQKYRAAFEEMERRQMHVSETRMEGGKLYVLAWAPSEDDKNRVWDEIKRLDPAYADLTLDIRTGQPQEAEVQSEVDRLAGGGGRGLAPGLAAAFRSNLTPAFGDMVAHLFGRSDAQQKAGLLNSLFAITPRSLSDEVLRMVGGGGRQVTPEQAEKVPPEAIQHLAEGAERHDPSVIDRVSEFYSEHPGLVKTLGVGALAVLTSKVVGALRGTSRGAS